MAVKEATELDKLLLAAKNGRAASAPLEQSDPSALIIPIERVKLNPRNARKQPKPGRVEALAATIKAEGVLQSIIVREITWQKTSVKEYEVIGGDTRLRAAMHLGLKNVPVKVRNVDIVTARRMNLIENIQRDDLIEADFGQGAIDLRDEMQAQLDKWINAAMPGKAGHKLTEMQADEIMRQYFEAPQWMHEAMGKTIEAVRKNIKGQTPTITWEIVARDLGVTVERLERMLKSAGLEPEIKEQVTAGNISNRAAYMIATVPTANGRKALAKKVVSQKLNVAETAREAQKLKGVAPRAAPVAKRVDPLENLQAANSFVAEGLTHLQENLSAAGYRTECKKALKLLRSNLDRWEKELSSG